MKLSNSKIDYILDSEIRKRFHDKKNALTSEIQKELDSMVEKSLPKGIDFDQLVSESWVETSKYVEIYNKEGVQLYRNNSERQGWDTESLNRYPIRNNVYGHKVTITKVLENKIKKYIGFIDKKNNFVPLYMGSQQTRN